MLLGRGVELGRLNHVVEVALMVCVLIVSGGIGGWVMMRLVRCRIDLPMDGAAARLILLLVMVDVSATILLLFRVRLVVVCE